MCIFQETHFLCLSGPTEVSTAPSPASKRLADGAEFRAGNPTGPTGVRCAASGSCACSSQAPAPSVRAGEELGSLGRPSMEARRMPPRAGILRTLFWLFSWLPPQSLLRGPPPLPIPNSLVACNKQQGSSGKSHLPSALPWLPSALEEGP